MTKGRKEKEKLDLESANKYKDNKITSLLTW